MQYLGVTKLFTAHADLGLYKINYTRKFKFKNVSGNYILYAIQGWTYYLSLQIKVEVFSFEIKENQLLEFKNRRIFLLDLIIFQLYVLKEGNSEMVQFL